MDDGIVKHRQLVRLLIYNNNNNNLNHQHGIHNRQFHMAFRQHRMFNIVFLFFQFILFLLRSRRPVPSLTNPNIPMSQNKKGQNNFFSYLPSSTSQNPASLNTIRSTSMMNNFLSTQNGQSSQLMNGGDMGQNFSSSMNVRFFRNFVHLFIFIYVFQSGDAYDMSSFYQAMDMMRNVSNDGVKRVYSEDSGMGSILDTESLMSVGGPSSSSTTGLFNSSSRNNIMPMDMNKEERFSRKVFVGGLPPDIDEGKSKI